MSELKTLTYVVKMDIGDSTEKSKQFRTTIKTMEQDATKASVEIDKLAKTIGEKYNTKVSTAIDQTNTVKNEIKASAREASKSEKAYSQLAREYTHLASRTGKTADEQEVLNAQYRLGASATKAQKDQAALLVTTYQAQRKAATQTQGSMRGLRGQAQNLGWQLQDVAVQAQMGTNALVILGQQGSQLASGFGATGALVGAAIAVVSAIAGVAFASSKASKKVGDFTADVNELASSLDGLSELSPSQMEKVFLDTQTQLKSLGKEYKEFDKEVIKASKGVELTQNTIAQNENKIVQLKLGNMSKEADFRGRLYSEYSDRERKNATLVANGAIKRAKSSLTAYKIEELGAKASVDGVEKQIAAQLNLQNEINKSRRGEATAGQVKQIDELIKSTKEQSETYGLAGSELSKLTKEKERDKLISLKANESLIKSNDAYWDSIIASEMREESLKEETKALTEKTKADSKALKEQLKAQKELNSSLQIQAEYDPNIKLALLQRQYAGERALLAGNSDALLAIDAHYADERTKINGTVWEKMAVSAKESIKNTDEMMSESLDRFVDGTAQAFGDAIVFSDNFGDAMKNIFKGALSSMISYFAELAIQQALMWAFTKAGETTVKTEQATSQAFINQASVFEAGLNAYKSTAAIPMIGPALAPAAAGTAIAATQGFASAANSLNFAGAFDTGGMIPSGSAGIVSEFGDELVGGTMIYNGSQGSLGVTGREDTAKKMGGSNNNISVNSYGNASPDAIARAMVRQLKKPNKQIDNAVYDSMNRGRKNGGKRFNA
tara:strand:- start:30313 stop:32664 length:2352 start_codon:yes stop_codon:yes gene_type:complete